MPLVPFTWWKVYSLLLIQQQYRIGIGYQQIHKVRASDINLQTTMTACILPVSLLPVSISNKLQEAVAKTPVGFFSRKTQGVIPSQFSRSALDYQFTQLVFLLADYFLHLLPAFPLSVPGVSCNWVQSRPITIPGCFLPLFSAAAPCSLSTVFNEFE